MTRCDWAACDWPALKHEDGWWHCKSHLRDHRAEFWPTTTSNAETLRKLHASFNLHRARGEAACASCSAGERDYQRERKRQSRAAA